MKNKYASIKHPITLIEVTVMLMVLAILTASLTPTVMRRMRHAKIDRARADTCAIRDAIMLFLADVETPGFAQNAAVSASEQRPVHLLVSDGDIPEIGPDGSSQWTLPVNFTTVDFLEYHLVSNNPGKSASRRYSPWKGAYLTAPINPDPWGNRYMVNVHYLWAGSNGGGSGGTVGTYTIGYWKNHLDDWPVDTVTIGGITYLKQDAAAVMNMNVSGDVTYQMFAQLAAAKLNVINGAESNCISSTIAAADNWMSLYGPVGSGVPASSSAWQDGGEALKTTLDQYNNGLLCAPHADTVKDSKEVAQDGSGYVYDVVVISAGPDEEIDSRFTMDGFVPGDDDIICLVSRGSVVNNSY